MMNEPDTCEHLMVTCHSTNTYFDMDYDPNPLDCDGSCDTLDVEERVRSECYICGDREAL